MWLPLINMAFVQYIKQIFLPNKYGESQSGNYKIALIILTVTYAVAFVAAIFSANHFMSKIFEDFSVILEETDNFYLSNDIFYYEGNQYKKHIDSISVDIIISSSDNDLDNEEDDFLFIGHTLAKIKIKNLSYSITYSELKNLLSDIDFSKNEVINEFINIKSMIHNMIISASVVIFILCSLVLLISILLISLIVYILFKYLKITIYFAQVLFISISSLVFPAISLLLIFIIPDGFKFFIFNFWMIIRLILAIILVYVMAVIIPYKHKLNNNNNASQTKRGELH